MLQADFVLSLPRLKLLVSGIVNKSGHEQK